MSMGRGYHLSPPGADNVGGFETVYNVDATSLETVVYTVGDATITFDGNTWTNANGTIALTSLGVTNGTGLIITRLAASKTLDIGNATSDWHMHIPFADLFDYTHGETLVVEAIFTSTGVNNTEGVGVLAGVVPAADASSGGLFVGRRSGGDRVYGVAQSTNSISTNLAVGAPNAVKFIWTGGSEIRNIGYGVTADQTFPAYTEHAKIVFGRGSQAANGPVWATATDSVIIATNSTSGIAYAPILRRLRIQRAIGSGSAIL